MNVFVEIPKKYYLNYNMHRFFNRSTLLVHLVKKEENFSHFFLFYNLTVNNGLVVIVQSYPSFTSHTFHIEKKKKKIVNELNTGPGQTMA